MPEISLFLLPPLLILFKTNLIMSVPILITNRATPSALFHPLHAIRIFLCEYIKKQKYQLNLIITITITANRIKWNFLLIIPNSSRQLQSKSILHNINENDSYEYMSVVYTGTHKTRKWSDHALVHN